MNDTKPMLVKNSLEGSVSESQPLGTLPTKDTAVEPVRAEERAVEEGRRVELGVGEPAEETRCLLAKWVSVNGPKDTLPLGNPTVRSVSKVQPMSTQPQKDAAVKSVAVNRPRVLETSQHGASTRR